MAIKIISLKPIIAGVGGFRILEPCNLSINYSSQVLHRVSKIKEDDEEEILLPQCFSHYFRFKHSISLSVLALYTHTNIL